MEAMVRMLKVHMRGLEALEALGAPFLLPTVPMEWMVAMGQFQELQEEVVEVAPILAVKSQGVPEAMAAGAPMEL